MPLHRRSAKALTLQRLPSRAIANATQEFVKPRCRMVGDAAQHVGKPSLPIDEPSSAFRARPEPFPNATESGREIEFVPARAFQPHARAKKLPRAAECLVYSLTPSGVLAENHPKNRGFVGILRGQKCLRRGFFTAISRWRVVSRRALDTSGF